VPQPLTIRFGEAVKSARTERGLSQEELGRRSGLHRAHVGEIERGEISPTLDSVQVIAAALGVTPSKLIADAEQPPL
jgi:transcriptional regulator with XRE-family HTH domain